MDLSLAISLCHEDRMEEKGREIAAIIQQIAKPIPGSSISVVWGYLNNDAETEKKMSDVIGVAATDEIVAQMYNEHFEQETFKSDVAKAVISTCRSRFNNQTTRLDS
mmetsp:Transcript_9168/g.18431  ORF Transcript_9168/g.18431 Transcript_9168/m.18431 type:complete len:107 (+) Transcript_9168:563-883(+)